LEVAFYRGGSWEAKFYIMTIFLLPTRELFLIEKKFISQ